MCNHLQTMKTWYRLYICIDFKYCSSMNLINWYVYQQMPHHHPYFTVTPILNLSLAFSNSAKRFTSWMRGTSKISPFWFWCGQNQRLQKAGSSCSFCLRSSASFSARRAASWGKGATGRDVFWTSFGVKLFFIPTKYKQFNFEGAPFLTLACIPELFVRTYPGKCHIVRATNSQIGWHTAGILISQKPVKGTRIWHASGTQIWH